jgi:hypothetical protein
MAVDFLSAINLDRGGSTHHGASNDGVVAAQAELGRKFPDLLIKLVTLLVEFFSSMMHFSYSNLMHLP